jgi:hypothetical protein
VNSQLVIISRAIPETLEVLFVAIAKNESHATQRNVIRRERAFRNG